MWLDRDLWFLCLTLPTALRCPAHYPVTGPVDCGYVHNGQSSSMIFYKSISVPQTGWGFEGNSEIFFLILNKNMLKLESLW